MSREQVWILQYLRAFAAIAVAASHTAQIIPLFGRGDIFEHFHVGAAGVDVFFVISGFIMCHITSDADRDGFRFFTRRLARVAPAYWVITLLIAAVMFVSPNVFRTSTFSVDLFLASLAFLPWVNAATGDAQPLLLIGWTLNYEFFFYTLFAVAMALAGSRRIHAVSATFAALWIAGLIFQPAHPIFAFYTNLITMEFVAGMLLWAAYQGKLLNSRVLGFALIALSLALLAYVHANVWVERASPMRVVYWGVPSFLLVAGALCFEKARTIKHYPILARLGDASYSIYLSHIITLGIVRVIWSRFNLRDVFSDVILMGFGIGACIIVGYAFHLWVERPLSAKFRAMVTLPRKEAQP